MALPRAVHRELPVFLPGPGANSAPLGARLEGHDVRGTLGRRSVRCAPETGENRRVRAIRRRRSHLLGVQESVGRLSAYARLV